ncbi:hypothetical protein BT67DRAFT_83638 [Trichocladium antarcticum]|uniref:Uncharacterized protein n=1 Tax=Trichocladium antarcticum TaxID=1450529 RepID=A0AAN6ZBW5_9PEZI|nr:hypothetical protein BT67DRAFT_83638 [Trichocladium antarcticum]
MPLLGPTRPWATIVPARNPYTVAARNIDYVQSLYRCRERTPHLQIPTAEPRTAGSSRRLGGFCPATRPVKTACSQHQRTKLSQDGLVSSGRRHPAESGDAGQAPRRHDHGARMRQLVVARGWCPSFSDSLHLSIGNYTELQTGACHTPRFGFEKPLDSLINLLLLLV